jgi:translation elongation factor EF-G
MVLALSCTTFFFFLTFIEPQGASHGELNHFYPCLLCQTPSHDVVRHFPTAKEGSKGKIERTYTGPLATDDVGGAGAVNAMKSCDPEGPVNVMISKLFPKTDCSAFDGFGRVMSGTLKKGQSVRVLVGTGRHCSLRHRIH